MNPIASNSAVTLHFTIKLNITWIAVSFLVVICS
ncbi:Uncharacterised protein [Vibrio cholerae]|nr:Uncharacterised protein [Vibrio cholerae]